MSAPRDPRSDDVDAPGIGCGDQPGDMAGKVTDAGGRPAGRKRHLKFLGIDIERRTDILAFAAFVISIGGLLAQMVNLVKGPDVQMDGPHQVLFTASESSANGEKYLVASALMTYLNTGSPGYDAILKRESVQLTLGERRVTLEAQHYVQTASKGQKLDLKKLGNATPVTIKSSAVVSHETYFVPRGATEGDRVANFIPFDEFLLLIDGQDEFQVRFEASTWDGETMVASCRLKPAEFVYALHKKGWSAPSCLAAP